ncbi:MAG: type I 3-dehydroquinate dehydratase [Phycisphaerae bacterium]
MRRRGHSQRRSSPTGGHAAHPDAASAAEGGLWDGDDQPRLARLIALSPAAELIDVEFATWQRSANVRQKIDLACRAGSRDPAARLILSAHELGGRPATLTARLAQMLEVESADVVKLVWAARTVRDNFEALELIRQSPKPIVATCTGPAGLPGRVLARKFGAFGVYAAASDQRPAAPGQPGVALLTRRYRWDKIGPQTRVFGVVGWPVEQSLSPAAHNAAFDAAGIDAVYLPLPVEPSYESFKALLVELAARPWLDWAGLSVTLPHKEHALRAVQSVGGTIDPACAAIGAANTLTFAGGRLHASNTDAPAAAALIAAACGRGERDLAKLRIGVLGAGGAARAVVWALRAAGAETCVFNRDVSRAARLAAELGGASAAWEARLTWRGDGWVNCTPIGGGDANESPLPEAALVGGPVVVDLVYRAAPTALVQAAAAQGCRVVTGVDFFIEQAARQFAHWTGQHAPRPAMAAAVAAELRDRAARSSGEPGADQRRDGT